MRSVVFVLVLGLSSIAWSAPSAAADDAVDALPIAEEAKTLVRRLSADSPDSHSLDALVAVFEADAAARPAKVAALARLDDVRLIPALGYLVRQDREVAVRLAAAQALGAYVHPKAETIAISVLKDRKESVAVRVAIVEALAKQNTSVAGDVLGEIALDLDEKGEVRQAATDALKQRYPALAEQLQLKAKIAGSSGRATSTVVGAASGAYTLSLVGLLAPNESVGALVGAFGGLIVGGAAGNLLARGYDIDEGDAQLMGSAGIWSVPTGYFAGRLLGGPNGDCQRSCRAVMLGTHLAAMGSSWALRDHFSFTTLDTIEVNMAALSGLFLGLGLVDLPSPTGDIRPGLGVLAAMPAVAFAAGAAFADDMHLSPPLAVMAAYAALEGLYLGHFLGNGLLPNEVADGPLGSRVSNPDKERQVGGLRWLGLGLGLGGVLVSSPFWQPTASDVQLIAYASALGHVLGGGIPLIGSNPGDRTNIAMTSSAVAGLASGVAMGLLAGPLKLDVSNGDALVIPLGLAFSAWQGFGWASLADGTDFNGSKLGIGLTVAGVGGLASVALSQVSDASAWKAAWAFSGAVWGGWLFGWGAYTQYASNKATMSMALVGSGLGLAAGSLLVSPLVGIDPARLAWTSIFGVAGMTLASMTAVFVDDLSSPTRTVSTANVAGSIVGLALGAFVSGWLVDSGSGADVIASWSGLDIDAPTVSLEPLFEPGGRRVEGFGTTLTWTLR